MRLPEGVTIGERAVCGSQRWPTVDRDCGRGSLRTVSPPPAPRRAALHGVRRDRVAVAEAAQPRLSRGRRRCAGHHGRPHDRRAARARAQRRRRAARRSRPGRGRRPPRPTVGRSSPQPRSLSLLRVTTATTTRRRRRVRRVRCRRSGRARTSRRGRTPSLPARACRRAARAGCRRGRRGASSP